METANYPLDYLYTLQEHNFKKKSIADSIICFQAIDKSETQVPDMICLCGRIYKDKFVDSDYSNQDDLNNAISWLVCDQ